MDNKIENIVISCLIKLGEEDGIKEFKSPDLHTEIQKMVDSMSLVALSVDIEEKYEEVFNKEVKVLNEEDANFLLNFETVQSLIDYVRKL